MFSSFLEVKFTLLDAKNKQEKVVLTNRITPFLFVNTNTHILLLENHDK